MNPTKSDFGESTISFSQTPSGEWQASSADYPYTFRLDGKDSPTPFGLTAAWKSLSANEWQTVWKLNTGMQVSTDAITLSPDGKTLTIHTQGIKATGGTVDDTTVYQRVAGTSGLVGKWKTKNVKSASPAIMELVLSGKDGISFRLPDIDITCDAKFDGKDVTCTRAGAAHPYSLAVVEGDRRTIAATFNISGKMVSKSSYAVSTDRKTLTETGVSANGEKVITIYDRQ